MKDDIKINIAKIYQKKNNPNKSFNFRNEDYYRKYSDDFYESMSSYKKDRQPEENEKKCNMLNNKERIFNSKYSTTSSNRRNRYENNEENRNTKKSIGKQLIFYEEEEQQDKNNIKNFNKNNDNCLIYIVNSSRNKDENGMNNSELFNAKIGLPFCHYHKYNLKLPKKYTCNFKNCSCCAIIKRKKNSYLNNKNNNYNNNNNRTFYVSCENKKSKNKNKNKQYRSVLDHFKNRNQRKEVDLKSKNKTEFSNNDKSIITETSESNQISDFSLHFLKPNNENMKLARKNFISGNTENSKDNTISSKLELPSECNINDGNDLRKYRNLVNNSNQKPKIHLSVLYYKKLNKSYNQTYAKDIKYTEKLKGVSKDKTIELLRE